MRAEKSECVELSFDQFTKLFDILTAWYMLEKDGYLASEESSHRFTLSIGRGNFSDEALLNLGVEALKKGLTVRLWNFGELDVENEYDVEQPYIHSEVISFIEDVKEGLSGREIFLESQMKQYRGKASVQTFVKADVSAQGLRIHELHVEGFDSRVSLEKLLKALSFRERVDSTYGRRVNELEAKGEFHCNKSRLEYHLEDVGADKVVELGLKAAPFRVWERKGGILVTCAYPDELAAIISYAKLVLADGESGTTSIAESDLEAYPWRKSRFGRPYEYIPVKELPKELVDTLMKGKLRVGGYTLYLTNKGFVRRYRDE